jgi:DNA-binding transcriptional MerR regulator
MNIGELARAADTKVETIRNHERIGLLHTPPRTAGNFYCAVWRILQP